MSKVYAKGAIPRVTQEIFYIANERGDVKINRALTIKEFDKKLGKIIQGDKK